MVARYLQQRGVPRGLQTRERSGVSIMPRPALSSMPSQVHSCLIGLGNKKKRKKNSQEAAAPFLRAVQTCSRLCRATCGFCGLTLLSFLQPLALPPASLQFRGSRSVSPLPRSSSHTRHKTSQMIPVLEFHQYSLYICRT